MKTLTACSVSINEYSALNSLYNSTNGPHWIFRSPVSEYGGIWNFTSSLSDPNTLFRPCTELWQGLTCEQLDVGKCGIKYMNLGNYNLTGVIPNDFSMLTNLQNVSFSSNQLTGSIPESVASMQGLRYLQLLNNHLSGTIPAGFPSLQFAFLGENSLSGTIPAFPTALIQLSISGNRLTGTIPSELASLQHLNFIAAHENLLTGTIPTDLGLLSGMQYFGLYLNHLTGTIPSQLGNLVELPNFEIYSNSLTGTIPDELAKILEMEYFAVNENELTGTIPSKLWELHKISHFFVFSNRLSGTVPDSTTLLPAVVQLLLFQNSFSGALPSAFGLVTSLQVFQLEINSFSGTLPTELGKLSHIFLFDVFSNRLTGTVPLTFSGMTEIEYLYLGQNYFTGTVPENITSMRLHQFYINDNMFTGNLNFLRPRNRTVDARPLSIFYPTLNTIDISDNGFTGTVPSDLFTLSRLAVLAASSNCFSGSLEVPESIGKFLSVIDLNGLSSGESCRQYVVNDNFGGYFPNNYMSGTIPSQFWSSPNLTTLFLSGNAFIGSLDASGFDPALSQLRSVSLSHNRITGGIPHILQTYGRFQELDLSFNRLSGTLYSDFAFSASSDSVFLNLSVNRLSGNLPKSSNITMSSNVVQTMLIGNLFYFDINSIPGNQQAAAQNHQGSFQVNVAAIITIPFMISMLLAIILYSYHNLVQSANADLAFLLNSRFTAEIYRLLFTWWVGFRVREGSETQQDLSFIFHRALQLQVLFVAVLVFCVVFYVALKSSGSFTIYAIQYQWTASIAFLHTLTPVVVMVLVVLVVAASALNVYPVHILFPACFGTKKVEEESVSFDSMAIQKITSQLKEQSEMQSSPGLNFGLNFLACVKFLLFFTANVAVMLLANAAYLFAVLRNTSFLIAIQLALALFKSFWGKTYIPLVIQSIAVSARSKHDFNFILFAHVSILIFNFILAPCVATALTDSSCFLSLFSQQPAIVSSFLPACPITSRVKNSSDTFDCFSASSQPLQDQTLYPPFIYNYQCGSALIVNYVPVLLYAFLAYGAVGPLLTLASMLRREIVKKWFGASIIRIMFSPIFMFEVESEHLSRCSTSSASSGNSSSAIRTSLQLSPNVAAQESPSERDPQETIELLNVQALTATALLHFSAFLTFGLAFPYLGLVILGSFTSILFLWRLVIGRYRHFHQAFSSDRAMRAADKALSGAISKPGWGPYYSLWLIVVVAHLFWALLSFDMVGDTLGFGAALTAFLTIVFVAPIMTFLATILITLVKKFICQEMGSGNGAPRVQVLDDKSTGEFDAGVRNPIATSVSNASLRSSASMNSVFTTDF